MEKLAKNIKTSLDNGDINIHAIRTLCLQILEGKPSKTTKKDQLFNQYLNKIKSPKK